MITEFNLEMQHDGELKYFKDMAGYVKKRIEDEEKGTSGWHVIIGKYKDRSLTNIVI